MCARPVPMASLNHFFPLENSQKTQEMLTRLNEMHRQQQVSKLSRERLLIGDWMCCQNYFFNQQLHSQF